jgi:hypothetical protein
MRFGQQLWTRAARWTAAFGSDPNPFLPMVNLLADSAWPVGVLQDTLQIITVDDRDDEPHEAAGYPPYTIAMPASPGRGVFLSGPFEEPFTKAVLSELICRGWAVEHGRVDERVPPEQQLARKIMQTQFFVAAMKVPDTDFGLPWWTFQELDFAAACGRPVSMVVGTHCKDAGDLPGFALAKGAIEEAFWTWLQTTT